MHWSEKYMCLCIMYCNYTHDACVWLKNAVLYIRSFVLDKHPELILYSTAVTITTNKNSTPGFLFILPFYNYAHWVNFNTINSEIDLQFAY